MKRTFSEMSSDINDEILNLHDAFDQQELKQYEHNRNVLYKIHIYECVLAFLIFAIWCLFLKVI